MRYRGRWMVLFVVVVFLVGGCRRPDEQVKRSESRHPDRYASSCLVEVTSEVGIVFKHSVGMRDDFSMPRIMGSGGAFLDYDGDGDLDILLIDGDSVARLWQRNASGYVDVTNVSGIKHAGYGMGVAVGDIDNDGDVDLYLTRYGDDRLYQNNGNGTFTDITDVAGIGNPQWGTAAAFFDYDRDGWLDLFVVNYVDFFPGSVCEDGSGRRDFCGPESLAGTVDKLYRNLGRSSDNANPKFEDVTVSSGIADHAGKGLGVLCRDFNNDGWLDVFVANDGEENVLWIQQKNGRFRNEALLRGVAVNRLGEPEANMGAIAEDLDGDGRVDLFVTHLRGETNTLFHDDGKGNYTDYSARSRLAAPSLAFTGFGVTSCDLDHDGDIDLAIANGRVKRGPAHPSPDTDKFWSDYAEPNQVFINEGEGIFRTEERLGGSDFATRSEVSRGLVSGDIDNDGDLDLLLTNCAGPARLYRNDFPKAGHWLMIRAYDDRLKRDAIGAKLRIRADSRLFVREMNPSTGYLSSNDMRAHVGLGALTKYDSIEVVWPDGDLEPEVFAAGEVDQVVTLRRGSGQRKSKVSTGGASN